MNNMLALRSQNYRVAYIQDVIVRYFEKNHDALKILWNDDASKKILRSEFKDILPVNIELVPSLECNLACPHCTYRNWKKNTKEYTGKRFMSYENMKIIIDKCSVFGVSGITVTGGGEPFLNNDTIRALEYADLQNKVDIGVFTNGTTLDEYQINRLSELGLSFLRISINTVCREKYLQFHGIANDYFFNSVLRNIELVGLKFAKSGSKASYGIAVIINEVNVDNLDEIGKYCQKLFENNTNFKLDYITIRPVVNYGQIDKNLDSQITENVSKKAIEAYYVIKERLKHYPVIVKISDDYFSDVSVKNEKNNKKCIGNAFCASIAYDGKVYLCSEHNGDPEYYIGNLIESSFEEIWNSDRRHFVLNTSHDCPPVCKINKFNKLLHELKQYGELTDIEIDEINSFLSEIRKRLLIEKISFLSW